MKIVRNQNGGDNVEVGHLGDAEVGELKDFETTYTVDSPPVDVGEDPNA